jgi:hypothetical protein
MEENEEEGDDERKIIEENPQGWQTVHKLREM